jgi:predicted small secreted protein
MTSSTAKALAVLLLACSPLLAACQTDAPAGPSAQAAPQGGQEAPPPLTHQEAAAQCWMSVEKTHQNMGLDQRADIVTKCINDKMKAAEQPAAVEPKSKPPKSKT